MDNLQIWIYVIVGLLYLIGRVKKKPADTNRPQNRSQGQSTSPEPKPLSFEDLLREITEAKEPQMMPSPKPVQEYVDYDDEIEEEKELVSTNYDYKREDTYNTSEQSKYEAFNRFSYEDTMKLEDTDVRFGKFKVFEEEKKVDIAAQIAEDFSDVDKVKRAFIMTEIFNRKYA
jgi:cell pole-organizing protein PopZ